MEILAFLILAFKPISISDLPFNLLPPMEESQGIGSKIRVLIATERNNKTYILSLLALISKLLNSIYYGLQN
jgi:hypothetical protein